MGDVEQVGERHGIDVDAVPRLPERDRVRVRNRLDDLVWIDRNKAELDRMEREALKVIRSLGVTVTHRPVQAP